MATSPKKNIILALPGTECSTNFLMQWSETILELTKQGYSIGVSTGKSTQPREARIQSMGTNILFGKDQKPFGEKTAYDVFVSIDYEVIFTPKQVIELIEDTDKYPFISGVYRMGDASRLSYVSNLDDEFFLKNGTYEFAKVDSVDPNMKHIPVKRTELGFFACTREVLEKLEYPYFNHLPVEVQSNEDKTIIYLPSDSEAFCMNLESAGYVIHVNTDLRVGHEKKIIA